VIIPLILKNKRICIALYLIRKLFFQLFWNWKWLKKLLSTNSCYINMIFIILLFFNLIILQWRFLRALYLNRIVWIWEYKINLSSFFAFLRFMNPFTSHQVRIEVLCFGTVKMLFEWVKYPLLFWFYCFFFLKNTIKVRPINVRW
jgi:hypothetical protein